MTSIDDRKNTGNIMQNLILENREKLSVTGVKDVLSFDDQIIIMETDLRFINCKRYRY